MNTNTDSFSVLISTYLKDSPSFLSIALNSIFNQTVLPNQVVLVVDGPITADLSEVIDAYHEKFPVTFEVWPLEVNVGLGKALNYGLSKCNHELVARMDADDISLPNRFEKQLGYLKSHPEIDVLGANVEEFLREPGDLKRINQAPPLSTLFNYSRWRNPINHPTVVFKKSVILAVGSYKDAPFFEDYYLWLRVLHGGYKIDNLPDVLVNFRNDINTIGRRHGYEYLKIEYAFFKRMLDEHIMNFFQFLINLSIRLPLRLLPKNMLSILYHYVLRKS